MNRDDYFRCKECKQLFSNDECELDQDKGYLCPNGCVKQYKMPDYESPMNDEQATCNQKDL